MPAAAASLAYVNGKYGITSDIWTVSSAVLYAVKLARLEKQDRLNTFYVLESFAKDPKSANRIFLLLPPDDSQPQRRTQWTYAEAYETVLKYAAWLKDEFRIQKNELVAMDFTNKPQFVWIWFALWSLGAIPAFINSNLREKAFVHCVRISSARLLLVDAQISGELLNEETRIGLGAVGTGRAVDTVVLEDHIEQQILSGTPYRAPDDARSNTKIKDPAILIYTSGTTGLPKAANVNWGKPISGYSFWWKLLGLKADDRYYSAMPLYHSSASILGILQVLGPGCTFVLGNKFSPRRYMKEVSETQATAIQYIGEMCRYLVSSPATPYDRAHKVRIAFGNGLRPDVWQKFVDQYNIPTICEFYGATEAPGAAANFSASGFSRGAIGRSGLIARTLARSTQALVRPDHDTDAPLRDVRTNFCTRVNTNEPGELIYALDPAAIADKFHGYYGNDKASNSKIIRDVFKKGDAYYRTGDLIRQDSDGRIWFVDRIGDTFRWKGENVSTAEVSEALGSHPDLQEANVYGVQLPGHDGRAGCAALVLKEGKKFDDEFGRQLAEHVRKRLPRYATPLFLRVVHEFEVTGTMKQTKVGLRNQGVNPSQTGPDEIFWLPNLGESYRPFKRTNWDSLVAGGVRL